MTHFASRPSLLRTALAVSLALCVLVAGWMAASPELHEHLHHDAGHADHTCLATMIASGGCESVVVAAFFVAACVAWAGTFTLLFTQWVRPLFLDDGVLEHGPPVRA